MAVLQTPVNCGGITFSTSGALTPSSAKVTVTALEATAVVTDNNGHPRVVSSNVSTGAVITSITMNGNTYAVTAGISAAMAAADATQLIYEGFTLVTG